MYSSYTKTGKGYLDTNISRMKLELETSQPIEVLIPLTNDTLDTNSTANTPYTPEQVFVFTNICFFAPEYSKTIERKGGTRNIKKYVDQIQYFPHLHKPRDM